jgi:hydroxypyruvate isomerase
MAPAGHAPTADAAVRAPSALQAPVWAALPFDLAPHLGLTSPDDGLFAALAGTDPVDQIRFAHDQGFRAVGDNFLRLRPPSTQARIGEALAQRNMTMGCFLGVLQIERQTFGRDDADTRAYLRSEVMQAIEVAERAGGHHLTCILGSRCEDVPHAAQLRSAVAHLRSCAELAEQAGVGLLVEAISRRRLAKSLVSSTDQAAEICRAIATPAVKMIFDVYQCQCETGDLTCSLDRAWDQVGCIQIADNPGRTEPGTGEVNFLHLLRHIRDKGWTGRVEMEHGTSRPGAEGARAVLDAYDALSRKLAGTPAQLGERGPMLDTLEPDHRGTRAT